MLKIIQSPEIASRYNNTERDALRDAIAAESTARSALLAGQDAAARARALLNQSEVALATAREGIVTAKKSQAANLARDLQRGGASTSASAAVKAARAAEVEAEDGVVVAKEALQQLEDALPELEEETKRARSDAIVARNVVLAAAAHLVLADAHAARLALFRAQQTLQAIFRADDPTLTFANGTEEARRARDRGAPLSELKKQADAILTSGLRASDERDLAVEKDIQEVWRAARQALLRDADARLPKDE